MRPEHWNWGSRALARRHTQVAAQQDAAARGIVGELAGIGELEVDAPLEQPRP